MDGIKTTGREKNEKSTRNIVRTDMEGMRSKDEGWMSLKGSAMNKQRSKARNKRRSSPAEPQQ